MMTSPVSGTALQRWLAVAVILLVLLAVWMILRGLIGAIVWAAVLAFLLHPLQRRLTQRFGGHPSAAAGVITGLTPIAIFVPLTLLGIAFAAQINALTSSLEDGGVGLFNLATWMDPQQHPRIAELIDWVARRFDLRLNDLRREVSASTRDSVGAIAKSGSVVLMGTAAALLRFFVMLFVLFFMLRDGSKWFARGVTLIPLERRKRYMLLSRLGKVLRAVVYGCGLTALVQGTMVGVGFAVAGLPGYVVFGVAAAVCGLLPFGGAALVWVPGVLFLFGSGDVGWAIGMLAWGLVVSTSDNFIRPLIISRYTPVPTLLVFLGVIGGVGAFGLLGFIIGPVLLVAAVELFRFAEGSLSRLR